MCKGFTFTAPAFTDPATNVTVTPRTWQCFIAAAPGPDGKPILGCAETAFDCAINCKKDSNIP
jgi:hypothetical protein